MAGSRLIDHPQVAALLGDVSDFAAYELDVDGVCVGWLPFSANYQRTPVDRIIGKSLDNFYPEDQKPDYWRGLAEAKENGRAQGHGWRIRDDGSKSWMKFVMEATYDDDGNHSGYVGVVFDATRQRESDRALHNSEEVYRALTTALRDHAICVLDKEGYVRKWNKDAPRILGLKRYEMDGRLLTGFLTGEQVKTGAFQESLSIALRDGSKSREDWYVRPDGSRFRAEATLIPLHDDDGTHFGFGAIVRDVTDNFDAERQLAETREALSQSEKLRSLGELTGGIAHDFNNLLTVVRGSAELLNNANLAPAKRERHLKAIIETADRAAELTAQLLSFARRQPLQPKTINVNRVIASMSDLLRRTLGNGIRVLNAPEDGLWKISVDPTQLQNLILNAAINARDAMDDKGTLTISTRNVDGPEGEEICLAIADTGVGMSPEVQARAIEPFFTTKAPGEGTGLGLSQAYGFAAQSGGRLEISSQPGRGTTLSLYLPRADENAESDDVVEDDAQVPRGTRILLVEDSRTVAAFAQSLLEEMQCEVVHALNAEEALVILEDDAEGEFDIIFSDIVMPGLSGLDLAAEIRSRKPSQPILLATGYSEAAARGEGSEFPILPKPYKREKLSEMLGKTICQFDQAA